MPLRISCPEGHTLVVSQARAGSTLRCPKCSAPIVVPPPVPPRKASRVDVAMSALVAEAEKPLAATTIMGEPDPPPIVAPPAEVAPPPVWTPPPKSRAIVEPPPEEMVQEARPATGLLVVKETDPEPPKPVSSEVPAIPVPPPEAGQESIQEEDPAADKVSPPEPAPDPVAVSPPREVIAAAEADSSPTIDESNVHLPLVPSPGQQVSAYVLSLSLAAAALFGAAPAIWDFVQYAQAAENAFVPRWALALVAIGIVQVAYAVYLAQLPDWMSGWIVTLVSLALAALYAAMLGITLLASEQSFFIRGLDLAEVAPTGRAAMWCLCMTSILATLAFFAGRTSLRWHAAEKG